MTRLRAQILCLGLLAGGAGCGDGADDRGGSTRPEPAMELNVDEMYDGDRVNLVGWDLAPGEIDFVQCVAENGRPPDLRTDCDLSTPVAPPAVVEKDGELGASVLVRVLIQVGDGRKVDCRREDCVIAGTDGNSKVYATASIPWSVGTTANPTPSP